MSDTAAPSLLGKIAGYTEILSKDPRSTIFVQLSETYRQMGMLDDALEIALKGVQTHPTFAPGHTALGRIQVQQGARDEAVAAFEKAIELDDRNLAALKGLVSLRLQSGDKEQARLLLMRVAAIKPDDEGVQKTLKRLAGTPSAPPSPAGERPQIKSPPVQTSNPSPQKAGAPISTPTIAEIYIKQGFPKRALKVYRDLLEADPHNEMIRQKLIALKKSLAAADQPVPRENSMADSADSGQGPSEAAKPAKTTAEHGEYADKLGLWLTSIQKGREHVR